jgi:predicted transcriptional regulator
MITVQLNDELSQAVERMAAQKHKPPMQLVTDAVIEMLEDYQDSLAAQKILAEIDGGEAEVLSWDEVKAGLYDLDN